MLIGQQEENVEAVGHAHSPEMQRSCLTHGGAISQYPLNKYVLNVLICNKGPR